MEQLLPFDCALHLLFHKPVDVIDIVIRFKLNGNILNFKRISGLGSIRVVMKTLTRAPDLSTTCFNTSSNPKRDV